VKDLEVIKVLIYLNAKKEGKFQMKDINMQPHFEKKHLTKVENNDIRNMKNFNNFPRFSFMKK
jgi:hypothetical protein